MNPKRWQEIVALYGRAVEMPEAERQVWLARECASDQELAREVERLIVAKVPAEFIEPPTPAGIGPMPTELEKRRLGDFELLSEIGRGGMGIVFRAWQRSVGRMVAVKVLPPSLVLSEHKVERFEREARAIGKLQHPGIAAVHAVGFEQGVHYFAMELVEGQNLAAELETLRARVRGSASTNSHLPDSRAVSYTQTVARLIREAADALGFAHQHGIVHRDVKPANLLLDRQGKIKLVDFGLARDQALGSITRTGELAGTPHYMSPEQTRAKRHAVDHRTDIYSLGVVMFELLTLKRPFDGRSSHEIVSAILFKEPPKVRSINPKIPRDLELICRTAMARDPKDRYQVAGALRDDLDRFLTHQSILAKPPSLGGRAWRWIRRNERVLGAAAAALVALVVGVNWQSMRAQAQALKPHLEAMAFGIQAGSLAELPPQQQFEIQAHLEALRERRDDLDAEQLSQVQTLEHKFESLRAELVQRGKNQLTTSRDPAQSDGAQQSSRLAAMQTLQHAALLFPRDTELKRLATLESAYPRVSVKAIDAAGQPIAASVAARVINDSSCAIGPPVALGRTPLDAIPLLPGTVRVIVAFDSGGSREMICFPGSQAQDIELVAVRRTDEESITRDMIAIPGGPFSIGGFGGEYRFPDSTLELEPYWIDSTEVSNAAYARFLEATGRQAPVMWKNAVDRAEFLAEHGQLPVSGVSWLDAVAYAEWAGKRLPTLAEWLCAAEGREHRPWPYAAEVGAPARGNVLQPLEPFGEDFENWEQYLRRTTTVESYPEARTPEGLFHLYGNVAEWTESTGVSLDPSGRPAVLSQARWYLGGWWEAATRRAPLRHPAYGGVGPKELSHTLGFRCAKSAGPR